MTNEEIAHFTRHKTAKSVQNYIRKNEKIACQNVLSKISESEETISFSFMKERTISCTKPMSSSSSRTSSSPREESETE